MSHEVENMMYVGDTPWHGLGIALENPPTAEEAIVAAGLNWEVHLKDLYADTTDSDTLSNVPSHKVVVRNTDKSILGVVGNRWIPLQNKEAFKFFDPFIESKLAQYHTAGSLKGGRRVWILAKVGGDPLVIAKGDIVEKYLLLSNAHDGKVAINVRFTPIRVVCNNTLTAAESDESVPFLRILHRGNVVHTLDKVQEIINMTNKTFEMTGEQYRFLAERQVKNIERFVGRILKPKDIFEDTTDEELEEIKLPRATGEIIQLFEGGRGQDIPSIRGTYWAAYNAVTEWVDYKRGNDGTRLEKAWFGKGQKIKSSALEIATSMAKIA